ncbi:50S ribosomal protein L23 [bacterium]|nr:50S ribosomal protein L23 [bacterium]
MRKLLKRPLQTEKVVAMQETSNTYSFEVPRSANKIEIKRAVEGLFEVKVVDVRTVTVHGKLKRMGRFEGRQKSWKKAMVTLQEGDSLDLYENV